MSAPHDLRDDEVDYDEFGFLRGYAEWAGIPWTGRPAVARRSIEVEPGQRLSFLAWGEGDPELVFLHGGGQNAHTWDSVAYALGRPLLAVDLPGHGHSSWRQDRNYWPVRNAEAVATLLEAVAPGPVDVVGMSLGGLTTIRLAGTRPDLVRRTIVVDVTPGVAAQTEGMTLEERGATAVIRGAPEYDSFDHMLAALAETMPSRPVDSLRPGLLHNARQREDGKWEWRHDLARRAEEGDDERPRNDWTPLWDDLASARCPMLLVRGGASKFIGDDDVELFLAKAPDARVEVVDGAGHSVQSDRPVVLARLISSFLDG